MATDTHPGIRGLLLYGAGVVVDRAPANVPVASAADKVEAIMHRFRVLLSLVALVCTASGAVAGEWALPPAGYTFAQPSVCATDPARAGKPTRPNQAAYRVCDDQMAMFQQGLADAKASGRLLLVSFGATWCPWCAAFQKHLAGGRVLVGTVDHVDLAKSYHVVEIALSTLDKGQKAQVTSGEAVLAMLTRASGVKIRSIPFLAVVDPADASRVFARHLDDVESGNTDFNLERVRAVLADAHRQVRAGQPAPAADRRSAHEPGWLVRQWRRLRSG